MHERKLMIFGGNANPRLTQNIASYLHQPIGKLQLTRFSDGETAVETGGERAVGGEGAEGVEAEAAAEFARVEFVAFYG